MLEKNQNFDFLKNITLPKESFAHFEAFCVEFYPVHFDSYHTLHISLKKKEELKSQISVFKQSNIMFFN